jgi:hypothetical protein
MSVAQGHESLDVAAGAGAVEPDGREAAPGGPAPVDPDLVDPAPVVALPQRLALPPRPAVRSGPAAWLRALRVGSLPLTLLGAAVGGLVVSRSAAARPGLLVLALAGLVVAHALGGLVTDLGDSRPGRAGPLRRDEAGRAALALLGTGALALVALVVLQGPLALVLAGAGAVAGLVAVSRKTAAAATGLAGLALGTSAATAAAWASTGVVDRQVLLCALLAGCVVAGGFAARQERLGGTLARVLVLAPYLAAGAGVALEALPWAALAVAGALPAVRRASSAAARGSAAPVVAGHTRLFAVLLLGGLVAAAVTGAGFPRG